MRKNFIITIITLAIAGLGFCIWQIFTREEPKVIKIYKTVTPDSNLAQKSPNKKSKDTAYPVHPHPHTETRQEESVLSQNESSIEAAQTEEEEMMVTPKTDWTKDIPSTSPMPSTWKDLNTSPPDLSPQERHRNQLLKSHGDIPEVHTFIDIYYRMKDNPVTFDEMLTMQELMYFFYPNEANRKGIEAIRALRDQVGGGTIIEPSSSIPSEIHRELK